MALLTALAVGAGGAAGAVARYAVGLSVGRRAVDTGLVNVFGSLLFGVAIGADFGGAPAVAVTVGFCGAFTTFSSFAVETVRLAEDGQRLAAAGNAVGTLAAALLAVFLGIALGAAL
ncbi:putative fluoride ion transport protein CrcB [Natronomonas pharaonis DSM 2160]|uniref:Fluoride-specific ion channel FluC 2 n=1 Tax=Natronomonas pharaonis (strain ATCC 35678 / DSM 2160 / CIP 103997 / JCM 8858 / NBRC 14720 / NCIMB 2260 / Gabara) TaxID=348780 RepID=FLUC2_NATPD|nr:CrcB family protein [Natronomonas pharaonis]Q3IUS6.1 RecName: Full=Fluoride-specific ion channel FluC 2 [Natronomonas pharaonis DSM 2160]CAI48104.1 putative fluoride ion transport protein CrcB [Natronomonas pharaonis DSM 2160]